MRRYIGEGCGRGHMGAPGAETGLTAESRRLGVPQLWARSSAVEQLTFNQWVTGSIPVGLTKAGDCWSAGP